jgi:hypothetical protein
MAPVLLVSSNERLGAVAQMGERMTGSHEVRGSIPLSSTKEIKELWEVGSTAIAGFTSILQQPDLSSSLSMPRLASQPPFFLTPN